MQKYGILGFFLNNVLAGDQNVPYLTPRAAPSRSVRDSSISSKLRLV